MSIRRIEMAHGGGGGMARELIEDQILARFGDGPLRGLPDAASLPGGLVFTTDSFVVQPFEFPGGNIGDLAVHGTVNDLAAAGGRPRWLSLALILEEGLPIDALARVLDSVETAAENCGVLVATGDTKVVARGQADGVYINTAGIGAAIDGFNLDQKRLSAGDHIVVSGPVGDHGAAVLTAREGIDIGGGAVSDSAPVHRLVEALAALADGVRFMRDPTRGGLAAVLNEVAEGSGLDIVLDETAVPVSEPTHAVAEMLGLDILQVASEGRLVAISAPDVSARLLESWRALPEGAGAAVIGEVRAARGGGGRLALTTLAGGERLVDSPRGELLPRIC